jgi:putative transposase
MPRTARLDIPGGLYHVIGRGVERRRIFRSDRDCADFEERLSVLLPDEELTLFAYVLMVNHFHLVVRRGDRATIGHFVQRLLTGYVGSFNLRYRRSGHLFQNRHKAILCEQDSYLTQLVRYVHLNPVRARMVEDPVGYRWSSHGDYLRNQPRPWVDTGEVLGQLGGRQAYRRFIELGVDEGHRADLSGSPRKRRRATGAPAAKPLPNQWFGGKVLGNREFAVRVGKLLEDGKELCMERSNRRSLGDLAAEVSQATGIRVEELRGRVRTREVSDARRLFVHKALIENEFRAVEVAHHLGISPAAVTAHLKKLKSEKRPL